MLSNLLLYTYNDSSYTFIYNLYRYTGVSYVANNNNLLSNIDPLTHYLMNLLNPYLNPVLLNNIFVLLSLSLSLFFSYKLFTHLSKQKVMAVVFAFLNAFSLYYVYRVTSATYALMFTFIFPLILLLIIKRINYFYIGGTVAVSLLISNYYGFFTLILCFCWLLSAAIIREIDVSVFIKDCTKLIMVPLFVAGVLFGPMFVHNIPIFGNYAPHAAASTIYRSIDDWYVFSFRPWYFVLPPTDSLFFAKLSTLAYEKIASTHWYLAQNYAEEEMAGSYMGWHFVLGFILILGLVLRKRFLHKKCNMFCDLYTHDGLILKSVLTIFLILLLSGPPSITIFGVTLYTPSYLLYHIIPVFRTLVRWSVVIYLLILVVNYFLVLDIYSRIIHKYVKLIFVSGFILLNVCIFAVRLPVINVSKPPSDIVFLSKLSGESTNSPALKDKISYIVFPHSNYYSLFWILYHKQYLVNSLPGDISNVCNVAAISTNDCLENLHAQYIVFYFNTRHSQDQDPIYREYLEGYFGNPIYNDGRTVIYKSQSL